MHTQRRGLDSQQGLILVAFPALGCAGCCVRVLPGKVELCLAREGGDIVCACPPRPAPERKDWA